MRVVKSEKYVQPTVERSGPRTRGIPRGETKAMINFQVGLSGIISGVAFMTPALGPARRSLQRFTFIFHTALSTFIRLPFLMDYGPAGSAPWIKTESEAKRNIASKKKIEKLKKYTFKYIRNNKLREMKKAREYGKLYENSSIGNGGARRTTCSKSLSIKNIYTRKVKKKNKKHFSRPESTETRN